MCYQPIATDQIQQELAVQLKATSESETTTSFFLPQIILPSLFIFACISSEEKFISIFLIFHMMQL